MTVQTAKQRKYFNENVLIYFLNASVCLKSIAMKNCADFSDFVMLSFKPAILAQLTVFNCHCGHKFTSLSIKHMTSYCNSLTFLNFNSTYHPETDLTEASFVDLVAANPTLSTLSLCGIFVTMNTLQLISQYISNLTYLSLCGGDNISIPTLLEVVNHNPKLKHIQLFTADTKHIVKIRHCTDIITNTQLKRVDVLDDMMLFSAGDLVNLFSTITNCTEIYLKNISSLTDAVFTAIGVNNPMLQKFSFDGILDLETDLPAVIQLFVACPAIHSLTLLTSNMEFYLPIIPHIPVNITSLSFYDASDAQQPFIVGEIIKANPQLTDLTIYCVEDERLELIRNYVAEEMRSAVRVSKTSEDNFLWTNREFERSGDVVL